MKFSFNGIRNAYQNAVIAAEKSSLEDKGYYVKTYDSAQSGKFKRGFKPFCAIRHFVGGDCEEITPAGTKILTRKKHFTDESGRIDPNSTHITKKYIKKNGKVFLSKSYCGGKFVDIFECKSTGNKIEDVTGLKKIFSSRNKNSD